MPVIALTQEMGSLAKDVSLALAQDLQLEAMQHEVVDHLASKMHVSRSLIRRLREGKAGLVERLRADKEGLAVFSAEEVLELAARDNVVLRGWGATCLLRPVSHVVCVRVTRPMAQRIDWLMEHLDTDDRDFAESEIRRSDQAHATRMSEQFGVSWGDPLLYDLVLNTERLSVQSCVEQIRSLTQRPEFAPTDASRAMLRNMHLQASVRSALRAHEDTHEIKISIECREGQVLLSGIVLNATERARAEEVAACVAGVRLVDNQLRLMAMSRLFTSAKN